MNLWVCVLLLMEQDKHVFQGEYNRPPVLLLLHTRGTKNTDEARYSRRSGRLIQGVELKQQ